jgi:protein-tyrosine phosphatase
MVDIHSHILPGIDDGAKSWEIALEMVRLAASDGIEHMVATPHANFEYAYDRTRALQLLNRLREQAGVAMNFSIGCDFHFSIENIESALQDAHQFTIGGTNYLLVEFSDYGISPGAGRALSAFKQMGITPIITHPERNQILRKRPELVVDFIRGGCLVQVTANSLTGHWGEDVRAATDWLMDHDAVHVIATDAHDVKRRPPILSGAYARVAHQRGQELAEALCTTNPQAIVNNEPLAYVPTPKQR